jgi:hypothetical protein
MQYVSPIKVLGLKDELDVANLNRQEWLRLKKKLLAEFELEKTVTIRLGEREFDKSQVLKMLDELAENKDMRFHGLILSNEQLLLFLEQNKVDQTYSDNIYYIKQIDGFDKFVEPYFLFSFNKALAERVEKGDVKMVREMVDTDPPIEFRLRRKGYGKTTTILLRELEEMLKLVPKAQSGYSDIERLNKFYNDRFIQAINTLPQQFDDFRNDYALALCKLGTAYAKSFNPNINAIWEVPFTAAMKLNCETWVTSHVRHMWIQVQVAQSKRTTSGGSSFSQDTYRPPAERTSVWSNIASLFGVGAVIVFLLVGMRNCDVTTQPPRYTVPNIYIPPKIDIPNVRGYHNMLNKPVEIKSTRDLLGRLMYFNMFLENDTVERNYTVMEFPTGFTPYRSRIPIMEAKYQSASDRTISVVNGSKEDMIVFLSNAVNILDHRYVKAGEEWEFDRLDSAGLYFAAFYFGKDWSPEPIMETRDQLMRSFPGNTKMNGAFTTITENSLKHARQQPIIFDRELGGGQRSYTHYTYKFRQSSSGRIKLKEAKK